ncbi:unnamed protein product [Arctogadus glacialis]
MSPLYRGVIHKKDIHSGPTCSRGLGFCLQDRSAPSLGRAPGPRCRKNNPSRTSDGKWSQDRPHSPRYRPPGAINAPGVWGFREEPLEDLGLGVVPGRAPKDSGSKKTTPRGLWMGNGA